MTPSEFVNALGAQGIVLIPEGKFLRVRGELTSDLRREIVARKPELLAHLAGEPPAGVPELAACYTCGTLTRWQSVHGALVCPPCHPPGAPWLVAGWIAPAAVPGTPVQVQSSADPSRTPTGTAADAAGPIPALGACSA